MRQVGRAAKRNRSAAGFKLTHYPTSARVQGVNSARLGAHLGLQCLAYGGRIWRGCTLNALASFQTVRRVTERPASMR